MVGEQKTAYERLKERLATTSDLRSTKSLLFWDQQTYMPGGGVTGRAEQMATLSRLSHEMLTDSETARLLDAAGGERFEALYVLAVTTGMRQGELLALRWQDVDVKNGTISVRRTLTRSGGPCVRKSRRTPPPGAAGWCGAGGGRGAPA